MVANKRLGRAHCRDFVPLADVDVIDSHPHMNLFGLKFIIKVCCLLRALHTAHT